MSDNRRSERKPRRFSRDGRGEDSFNKGSRGARSRAGSRGPQDRSDRRDGHKTGFSSSHSGDGRREDRRFSGRDGRREERRFSGRDGRQEERRFSGRDGRRDERRFGGRDGRRDERRFGGRDGWQEERRFGGRDGRREERRFSGRDGRQEERRFGGRDGRRENRRFGDGEDRRFSRRDDSRRSFGEVRQRRFEGWQDGPESAGRQASPFQRRPKRQDVVDLEAREPREDLIIGRNPVMEALKSGRPMEKVLVQDGATGSARKIAAMAKDEGVVVEVVERKALDRIADGASHQGVCAFVSAHEYAELEDCFRLAEDRGEPPFFVVLDGIEDPGNLGAVLRTAECAGAHGVIIPKRRAAGLTDRVAKASAGAIEYMPCVRVPNLPRLLDSLKESGLWIFAADMDGEAYTDADFTGPCAIVIGAEGKGVSRLVKEKCDLTVSLPMKGKINSLNASSCASVLMYEMRRQRDTGAAIEK